MSSIDFQVIGIHFILILKCLPWVVLRFLFFMACVPMEFLESTFSTLMEILNQSRFVVSLNFSLDLQSMSFLGKLWKLICGRKETRLFLSPKL